MPYDKLHKPSKHRRRKHKCYHKVNLDEHSHGSYWWLSGCQVAPTAPTGFKELCEGHAGRRRLRNTPFGFTDTYGQVIHGLRAAAGPPVITRRWSSVEVGTHQVSLASSLPSTRPKRSATSMPQLWLNRDDPQANPTPFRKRYRSSTFTRGAIDHDIVRTIRRKLTTRKLPSPRMETPATITLRRASRTSIASVMSAITGLSSVAGTRSPDSRSGGTTPLADPSSYSQLRRPSTAYLITSSDIDSITELIAANLPMNHRSSTRYAFPPPSVTPLTPHVARTPTITNKGLVLKASGPVESALTVAEVQRSCAKPHDPLNYLQVSPAYGKTKDTLSRTLSERSVHEVIWEGGGSPQSICTMTEPEDFKPSSKSTSPPQPGTLETTRSIPCQNPCRASPPKMTAIDKGNAFDPLSSRASINEWSWRSRGGQNEIPVIVTSSESESSGKTPYSDVLLSDPHERFVESDPKVPAISKTRTSPRVVVADGRPSDVVSFPPLPARKATSDWYSPLPDIETPTTLSERQSLYDVGMDVTCGPPGSKSISGKADRTSWIRSAEVSSSEPSRAPTPGLRPDYEIRRKSIVKNHPKAPARIGSPSALGSSVGASSGERRRSSAKSQKDIQRVRTIDNKPERSGTWTKRRPPSICPPPKTPSPTEDSDSSESWLDSLLVSGTGPTTRSVSSMSMKDRMDLITDRTPALPKADHAGIFSRITGTSKKGREGGDECKREDECKPHVCDDCKNDPRNSSVDWIG